MHQTISHSEVNHAGADVENNVTVAYTSDKGLCGGINSTVTKYTRGVLRSTEGGETSCVRCMQVNLYNASTIIWCDCCLLTLCQYVA